MPNTFRQSIHQSFAILSLLTLTLLLAGAGCSDSGSTTGPADDNGNGTVDSVSFADDVLPIFQNNCSDGSCHVPGPEPSTGLSLKDYASVIDGSNTRGVVIAGNAEDSELIKRMEGRAQPSMPLNLPLLPAATVRIVRDWIDQGAQDN